LSYQLSPEAAEDLKAAVFYYEDCRSGLGAEFLSQFEAAVARILEFPEAWPFLANNKRRYVLNRFPYQVVYGDEKGTLTIFAVMHTRQKPRNWK